MLTSHCNNLSTPHYYLTYHPCFDTHFRRGQTTQRYFSRCCHVFKKKAKAIELPFCSKESVRKKKKRIGLTKLPLATESYYTQHESEEAVPGNRVAVILWLYSSVLIMFTRKQFVLFPIQFITILTRVFTSRQTLLPWGVFISLESVVVA